MDTYNNFDCFRLKISFLFALVIILGFNAQAQLNCSSSAYLFQRNPSTVYELDLATGDYTSIKMLSHKVNAVGYHPFDEHIYGWSHNNNKIVKINENFDVVEIIDPPAAIADKRFAVGDITSAGDYVIYHPNTDKLYTIDLSTRPASIIEEFDVNISNTWDIAVNPVDGNLYGMSGSGVFYRVDPTNGIVTNLGRPSPLVANQAFGACYFDGDGNFYASGNKTGVIYRITDVHNLAEGANPSTIEFALGPSSGTNDGVKCPFSQVSPEGCANGIDDDGDGLIDCLDGDCFDSPACTTSGGGNGGLETNGSLSAKIAKRDFMHAKNNVNLEDRNLLPQVEHTMLPNNLTSVIFRDNNIAEFMPIDVIEGSKSFESSPNDLVELANATQVESVDIYINNRRIGAVLGIKSENGIYQHTKYVCDRVKGAQILKTQSIPLVGNDSFPVTYFKNVQGGREYSTLFSVYENENNEFVVETHWNTEAYPKDHDYYNFQIWANSISRVAELTQEVMRKLDAKQSIASINWSPLPKVIVKKHWYENEIWNVILENKTGVKKATFKGLKASTETELRIDEEFEIILNGNLLDTVEIPLQFYTLGGLISTAENESKDQIYVGNGSWGLSYDKSDNIIHEYAVSKSLRPNGIDSVSLVERNVKVKGELNTELTIFRTMQNAAIAKDFSKYNALVFELEGTKDVEIVLNKESITVWSEQPRLKLQTEGKCKQVYASKEDFYQPNNLTDWDDIKSIAFVFKGEDGNEEKFEVEIRNLAFAYLNERPECRDYNSQEISAFPNPMKDKLNLKISAGGIESYTLIIRNQLGQLIATQEGQTDAEGRLQYLNPNLENGMYYYSVQLNSGTYSGKVIVENTKG